MKKKNVISTLFVVGVMLLMLFLGTGIFSGGGAGENEAKKATPELLVNGQINEDYFDDFESYVAQNFRFRKQMLGLFTELKLRIFGVSNVDSVVIGKEGYLFFDKTLGDYQRQNLLTERELQNTAGTLALMEEYANGKGAAFAFVVAPNKNSIYGQYMPDQYLQTSGAKNIELLPTYLKEAGVTYVDAYHILLEQKEVSDHPLYFKEDTHWNSYGASLVYQGIMASLAEGNYASEALSILPYCDSAFTWRQDFEGDLQDMLAPLSKSFDYEAYSDVETTYSYLTRTRSVEQNYIETENSSVDQKDSLLMFRDSFGNALLPMMANSFHYGIFDKSMNYDLTEMEAYEASAVVLEVAERNIYLVAESAPIFEAPCRGLSKEEEGRLQGLTLISLEKKELETASGASLLQLKGAYEPVENSKLYVKVVDAYYELTPQTVEGNPFGFVVNLPSDLLANVSLEVEDLGDFLYDIAD